MYFPSKCQRNFRFSISYYLLCCHIVSRPSTDANIVGVIVAIVVVAYHNDETPFRKYVTQTQSSRNGAESVHKLLHCTRVQTKPFITVPSGSRAVVYAVCCMQSTSVCVVFDALVPFAIRCLLWRTLSAQRIPLAIPHFTCFRLFIFCRSPPSPTPAISFGAPAALWRDASDKNEGN